MSVPFLHAVRLDYARLAALARGHCSRERREALAQALPGMLGAACYGDAACRPLFDDAAPDVPLAAVGMARLGPASMPTRDTGNACFEIWRCDAGDVKSGRHGPLLYRFSESAGIVFGSVSVHEEGSGLEQPAGATPLERAAFGAYEAIFSVLEKLDVRHPLRIWNVVPAINAEQFRSERYRQFNTGRRRAFEAFGRPVFDSVPAASALGVQTPITGGDAPAMPLIVSFLATRSASAAIENPRQISAYRYPVEYGPSAPTFARAAAWSDPRKPGVGPVVFVSGTASIVGHETMHRGNTMAQLRETLANIEAVLGEAACQGHGRLTLADLTYTVYVRDPREPASLAAIDELLRTRCGGALRVLYLHADICRADLLLEIEASAGHGVECAA